MTFRTEPSSYLFSKRIRIADARRPGDTSALRKYLEGVAMVPTHGAARALLRNTLFARRRLCLAKSTGSVAQVVRAHA